MYVELDVLLYYVLCTAHCTLCLLLTPRRNSRVSEYIIPTQIGIGISRISVNIHIKKNVLTVKNWIILNICYRDKCKKH